MNKKLITIVSALLMLTVFLSACGNNDVNGPTPQTSLKQTTTEAPTEETTTQSTTEKEIKTDITEIPTDVVSDPTRASTTDTEVFINFLYEPEKIVFYSDGKAQTLTKEMSDEIIKEINKVTKYGYWDYLKLAVFNEYIDEIKEKNLCIEIHYDGIQILNDLNGKSVKNNTHRFEKVLIVLDGDNKNTMFLEKDGEYQSGPLFPLLSDLSEEILEHIFDE